MSNTTVIPAEAGTCFVRFYVEYDGKWEITTHKDMVYGYQVLYSEGEAWADEIVMKGETVPEYHSSDIYLWNAEGSLKSFSHPHLISNITEPIVRVSVHKSRGYVFVPSIGYVDISGMVEQDTQGDVISELSTRAREDRLEVIALLGDLWVGDSK